MDEVVMDHIPEVETPESPAPRRGRPVKQVFVADDVAIIDSSESVHDVVANLLQRNSDLEVALVNLIEYTKMRSGSSHLVPDNSPLWDAQRLLAKGEE